MTENLDKKVKSVRWVYFFITILRIVQSYFKNFIKKKYNLRWIVFHVIMRYPEN